MSTMKYLSLNTRLVLQDMKRVGMTRPALCKKWNISRQVAWYIFNEKPASYASRFAKLLGRPVKDYIQ